MIRWWCWSQKASRESWVWSRWWLEKIVKVDLFKQDFKALDRPRVFFRHYITFQVSGKVFGGVNNENKFHTFRSTWDFRYLAWLILPRMEQHFGSCLGRIVDTGMFQAVGKSYPGCMLDMMLIPSRKNESIYPTKWETAGKSTWTQTCVISSAEVELQEQSKVATLRW